MSIIANTQLTIELPEGYTTSQATNAVNEASGLTNAWTIKYGDWPDYNDSVVTPPHEISRSCIEIAKALYYLGIGQTSRDGSEQNLWQDVLTYYKGYLATIEIEPTIKTVTIDLDSNGVQLISRDYNILPIHPLSRIVDSSIWNRDFHWSIRKGFDSDNEYIDGWYLDAATYQDTIQGTLHYAITWRNDFLDYQKYCNG